MFVGQKSGRVYSTYVPIGETDEDIAYSLHAEFLVVKRFFIKEFRKHDEPLRVVLAKDEH